MFGPNTKNYDINELLQQTIKQNTVYQILLNNISGKIDKQDEY